MGDGMPIDHVVALVLENRSFDHMLGFLDHPDPRFEGLSRDGTWENPGWEGGPRVVASPQAKKVLPLGPDHSHDAVMEQLAISGTGATRTATNQGFVTSYERKARGLAPPEFGGLLGPLLAGLIGRRRTPASLAPGRGPLAMLCQPRDNVPVLSRLALDFAVCDHWFCSVPGETWPNRNYLHAATSDGETNIELRPYTDRTIFDVLEDSGHRWRIYHDDTPQVWAFPKLWDTPERHGNWFAFGKFAEHVAAGNLAAYSFIEPNHRPPVHFVGGGEPPSSLGTSQHPENNLVPNDAYDSCLDTQDTDFAKGEALIATVYETLRANPTVFVRTLLLITYDEHGGLYDHLPPPTGVPSPGDPQGKLARLLRLLFHRKSKAFAFDVLGPRVPAVLVSPLIPAGTLDQRVHDHASVPATLREVFAPNTAPLTSRDAWSPPFPPLPSLPEPRPALPALPAWVRATGLPAVVPAPGPVPGAPPVTGETETADAVPEATAQP